MCRKNNVIKRKKKEIKRKRRKVETKREGTMRNLSVLTDLYF